ncbi:glycosyltransferase [Streptomyces sp. NBC_00554]|uniref:glycosyltransferase n=1 Tax=Streptomyces sp. NBC_00554 TaxID=2903661 RepID=UPI00352DAD75
MGAGAARNLAANEVTADWLTTSDDDDVLPAQSFSVLLRYAQTHDPGWCAGWSAHLHPDRSITAWRCSTPNGFHAPGDACGSSALKWGSSREVLEAVTAGQGHSRHGGLLESAGRCPSSSTGVDASAGSQFVD